jgi:hypothetical protein
MINNASKQVVLLTMIAIGLLWDVRWVKAEITDPTQATVTKIVKKADWKRNDQNNWQPLYVKNWLYPGDGIRTGVDAAAEWRYSDGSVGRVGALTKLQLTGKHKRELRLNAGRVWLHIQKSGAGMKVVTPGAVAAVTGTELMVEYDDKLKLTEVTVFEGSVNVTGDVGDIVRVLGGTSSRVPFQAPAAPALPMSNLKVESKDTIFRPLMLQGLPGEDGEPQPELNNNNNTKPNNNDPGKPGDNKPNSNVDLKEHTDTLLDPRTLNGSPTTGKVQVIIE